MTIIWKQLIITGMSLLVAGLTAPIAIAQTDEAPSSDQQWAEESVDGGTYDESTDVAEESYDESYDESSDVSYEDSSDESASVDVTEDEEDYTATDETANEDLSEGNYYSEDYSNEGEDIY